MLTTFSAPYFEMPDSGVSGGAYTFELANWNPIGYIFGEWLLELPQSTTSPVAIKPVGVPSDVVMSGIDICSDKISLDASLNVAGNQIDALYVCTSGYVSLGNSQPEILKLPDQLDSLHQSTIIATFLKSETNNYVSVDQSYDVSQISNITASYIIPEDPNFLPEYFVNVSWYPAPNSGNGNLFNLIFIKDENYAERGVDKLVAVFQYLQLVNVEDNGGQYARVGVFTGSDNGMALFWFFSFSAYNDTLNKMCRLSTSIFH